MFPEVFGGVLAALTIFLFLRLLGGAANGRKRRIIDRARQLERQRLEREQAIAPASPDTVRSSVIRDEGLSSNQRVASFLRRFQWSRRRAQTLERADLPLKVSEYLAIVAGLAIVGGALTGWITDFIPAGLVVAAAFVLAGETWVGRRAAKRLERFNQQLPQALQMMSTSLQSGFGIMDSIRTVARDMDPPLSQEFGRLLNEARAGGSFEESLQRLNERIGGTDLLFVVQALTVHRKVGGDLGAILNRVAATMREREKLRRDILSMTAQERISAIIIALLPIWAVGFFLVTSPDTINELWTTQTGQIMLTIGIGLEVIGFFLTRRVVRIEV